MFRVYLDNYVLVSIFGSIQFHYSINGCDINLLTGINYQAGGLNILFLVPSNTSLFDSSLFLLCKEFFSSDEEFLKPFVQMSVYELCIFILF